MTKSQDAGETVKESPASTAVSQLEELAGLLNRLGRASQLITGPAEAPRLLVRNPQAAGLDLIIYAAPDLGGWSFWWPWAEPIAASAREAAAAVARALTRRAALDL